MNRPKRHHYVPRMLLRQWEDGAGSRRVHVMDKTRPASIRRARVDDVTVIGNFYTGNRERDGRQPDLWVEEFMGDWESLAKEALTDLLRLEPKRRGSIVPWLYFQLLRTPQGQAGVADDFVATMRKHAREPGGLIPFWAKRKGRRPDPDEAMALAIASAEIASGRDDKLLHPGPTDVLHHMMDLVVYGDFGLRLEREGAWGTLRSDPDAFVLGDHPVTYTGQYNPAWPLWRQEELPEQITMPISHEVCIEVRARPRPPDGMLSREEIDQINLRAWHWSDRWVIAREPEPLARVAQLAATTACRSLPPQTAAPPRRR